MNNKSARVSANTDMNKSTAFVLSPLQRSILKGLSKCEQGTGIMLDKRFKRNAATLVKIQFVECVPSDNGQNVYVITESGRRALKKAEAAERKLSVGSN